MGNLQFSYPVIVTLIGCLAVVYIMANLAMQFISKVVFDWFSKGRKKENNINDTSNNALLVSFKESHLKIEGQILKVLEVQNEILLQVKDIKISKFTEKVGNNGIK